MRMISFCVSLVLFICSVAAQPYNIPVHPNLASQPTQAPSALPYQNFQPWSSQLRTPAPSWPVNIGAAQQIPASIPGTAPYSQTVYQPMYGAQQPISGMPMTGVGSVGAANAGGFGEPSLEQLQQLALQAAQPTLSQWAADTAQTIFARSRGNLNSAAMPPATNFIPQQVVPANGWGNSFTFASPAVPAQPNVNGPASPAAARAAYAVLPSNGQFISNTAPAAPAAAIPNAPAPLAAIPPANGN